MASEADVLEITSSLLSSTNRNQFNEMSELKEIFESQKKWIGILIGRRFPIQLIPSENIVDVAKKMTFKSFVSLMTSCKWVNALLTEKRPTFTLKNYKVVIDYNKRNDSKLPLEKFQYYRLCMITFCNFENNVDELLAMLNSLNGTVLATHVNLVNTLAIKELFLYLRPDVLTMKISCSSPNFCCPIAAVTRDKIPGHLKTIYVHLDGPSTVELLENVVFHFVGKSQKLKIRVSLQLMSYDILYDRLEVCMKNLAISKSKQEIVFELNEYLTGNHKFTIVEAFQSKAVFSGLVCLPCSGVPLLRLFYEAEPGLIAILLKEKAGRYNQRRTVAISYCPTKRTVRELSNNVYTNDDTEHNNGDLTSLRDMIEDHFSSINVHDVCYEPFEKIEEHKFQLQPKQLETSELQLILDWKERKPLPQLSWGLPVTKQVEKQLELLREAVDIQEQWITFLRQGKVILGEIPQNCVLEILKRMDTKTFTKALKTNKEIKEFIDCGQSTFRKDIQKEFTIKCSEIHDMDQWVTNELECRGYFRFEKITFVDFENQNEILQAVVSKLAGRNILCDKLELRDTALTQKMMESLCPRYIYSPGKCYGVPQSYPEHVRSIYVMINDCDYLISAVENLAGKKFHVKIALHPISLLPQYQPSFMQAIRYCIKEIATHRSKGYFTFDCTNTGYRARDINQQEISQGYDYISYILGWRISPIAFFQYRYETLIFVAKVAGGVVAGVFNDYMKMFLWKFLTTMKDLDELLSDGTMGYLCSGSLKREDDIAFSTICSYFSQ